MKESDLQNYKKSALTGFFWRFFERISSQLVSFIVSVIIARILLPEEYGVVALTLIFINLLDVFVANGIGTSIIQKKDVDKLDINTMFVGGTLFSLLLYTILFMLSPFISDFYDNDLLCPILRIMGLRLPLSSFNSIQQAIVSRQLRFKKFFYSTLLGTVISGVCGILMAYQGYGVWALVAQYLLNITINTITLNLIIKWIPKIQFSYSRFKGMFSFAWKLMCTGFIGTFFNQLQNFVIGSRFTPSDLAFYYKGGHIPTMISTNISNTLDGVLFPIMSKIQDDKNQVKRSLGLSMRSTSLVVFPMMLMSFSMADKIILVLLTEKWLNCVPYMRLMCIMQCFMILNTANLQAIKAIGRSDISLKLEFIKKPLFIVFLLISMQYTPIMVALFMTIYSFVALIINSYPNKKLLQYGYVEQIKDILPNVFLSIIVSIVVFLIGLFIYNTYICLLAQVIVGVVFYIFLCVVTKSESFIFIYNSVRGLKKNRKI